MIHSAKPASTILPQLSSEAQEFCRRELRETSNEISRSFLDGDFDRAQKLVKKELNLVRVIYGPESIPASIVEMTYAKLLAANGVACEALSVGQSALNQLKEREARKDVLAVAHEDMATILALCGGDGAVRECERNMNEAFNLYLMTEPNGQMEAHQSRFQLAKLLIKLQDYDRAGEVLRSALIEHPETISKSWIQTEADLVRARLPRFSDFLDK